MKEVDCGCTGERICRFEAIPHPVVSGTAGYGTVDQQEIERIDRISLTVYQLLHGQVTEPIAAEGQKDDEIRQLSVLVNQLAATCKKATEFSRDLSERGPFHSDQKADSPCPAA